MGFCGFAVNIWLYFDDINNRGGILNNIAKKKQELDENMETPKVPQREIKTNGQEEMFVGETKFNEPAQETLNLTASMVNSQALKRSMARASLAGR